MLWLKNNVINKKFFNAASAALVAMAIIFSPLSALALTPNDPLWSEKGVLKQLQLPEAWDVTQGSSEVVVAVIDTGVDITNPDLAENTWSNPKEKLDGADNDEDGYVDDVNGWNFVDNNPDVRPHPSAEGTRIGINHGTVVAGIIGAVGDNYLGSAGINWHVKIMPLKILNEKGDGDSDLAVKAIDYAINHGANIINLSFVGPTPSLNFIQAIRRAYRAGITVVAAAGNAAEGAAGLNLDIVPQYPVCFDDPLKEENWVIGVAALNDEGTLAAFSNYGARCVDIAAPGYKISSTQYFEPSKGYNNFYGGTWSGTSAAAPFVSGVAALIKSLQPTWGPNEIRRALVETSDPIPGNDGLPAGRGSLNAAKAVTFAAHGGTGGLPSGIFVTTEHSAQGAVRASIFDTSFKPVQKFVVSAKRVGGQVSLTTADLESSGALNIIAAVPDAQGTLLKIYQRDGKLLRQLRPFGKKYKGPAQIFSSDINFDGKDELFVAPANGKDVAVVNSNGSIVQTLSLPTKFNRLSVNILHENNRPEIVTIGQTKQTLEVYVWDAIGAFIRSFTIPVANANAQLSVVDRLGNGEEKFYLSEKKSDGVYVRTISVEGAVEDAFVINGTQKNQPFGFAFGRVIGGDGIEPIVASQTAQGIVFDVFDFKGALRTTTILPFEKKQLLEQIYFAR